MRTAATRRCTCASADSPSLVKIALTCFSTEDSDRCGQHVVAVQPRPEEPSVERGLQPSPDRASGDHDPDRHDHCQRRPAEPSGDQAQADRHRDGAHEEDHAQCTPGEPAPGRLVDAEDSLGEQRGDQRAGPQDQDDRPQQQGRSHRQPGPGVGRPQDGQLQHGHGNRGKPAEQPADPPSFLRGPVPIPGDQQGQASHHPHRVEPVQESGDWPPPPQGRDMDLAGHRRLERRRVQPRREDRRGQCIEHRQAAAR